MMNRSRASNPSALSNKDLLSATRALVGRSNAVTCELIIHLAEVDQRKLYLEQAQPSMFAWCVAELGCSEDVACNWIKVARGSRTYPLVLDAIREGKVHLTGLRMLAPHLTVEGHRDLLNEAAGRSKREIEELIAKVAPRPAVAASIRKIPLAQSSRGKESAKQSRYGAGDSGNGEIEKGDLPVGTEGEDQDGGTAARFTRSNAAGWETEGGSVVKGGSPARDGASAHGGTLPLGDPRPEVSEHASQNRQRRQAPGRVEPLSEEAYKITFTASRRLRDKIRQAQDLLGHQVQGGDLAEIVERGLDLLVEERGKRCPATRRLELDHVEGFARGALHNVEGLRLRCRPHNVQHAEQMYGRAFMEKKRAAAKSSAPARVVRSSPPSAP